MSAVRQPASSRPSGMSTPVISAVPQSGSAVNLAASAAPAKTGPAAATSSRTATQPARHASTPSTTIALSSHPACPQGTGPEDVEGGAPCSGAPPLLSGWGYLV